MPHASGLIRGTRRQYLHLLIDLTSAIFCGELAHAFYGGWLTNVQVVGKNHLGLSMTSLSLKSVFERDFMLNISISSSLQKKK